jgi:hypothetical protein
MRRLALILSLATAMLAACAAPASVSPATGSAAADTASKPAPPTSTPYPPRPVSQPVAVDYSCRSDSDCAVKDVGNCCGTMPACVNKDSPTDPQAVRAQCAASGRMGICGFQEISSCQCVSGRCESAQSGHADPVRVN